MYSLVIPSYCIDKDSEDMTLKCIESYKDYFDEIIVTEDAGMFSEKIKNACTSYIYNNVRGNFTKNVNRGWKMASGDYVAIVSTDTYLVEGNPRDLCIQGFVTSPEVINQEVELAGCFFVVPDMARKAKGMLKEEMTVYYSDTEYAERIKDIFKKVNSVKIYHHGAVTVKKAGCEGHDQMVKDKEAYDTLLK
jgi:glycosyltransferase involved in cell wall biosynthesis